MNSVMAIVFIFITKKTIFLKLKKECGLPRKEKSGGLRWSGCAPSVCLFGRVVWTRGNLLG